MKIFFFHHSDNLIPVFGPHPTDEHTANHGNFYWCYDRYHNYLGRRGIDRYVYFFLKDIAEIEDLRFMQGNKTLKDVQRYYHRIRNESQGTGLDMTGGAPILRSKTVLKPDVTIEIDTQKNHDATIVHPAKYRGIKLLLFSQTGDPIPLDSIEPLQEILPNLQEAFPFSDI